MTAEELESVRQELNQLETEGRREIAARIKTAREWGDLKENAEYHAAKEDQAHLETRILKLRDQVRKATVVEASRASDSVQHGSTVSYTDRATNRQQTFRIVVAERRASLRRVAVRGLADRAGTDRPPGGRRGGAADSQGDAHAHRRLDRLRT